MMKGSVVIAGRKTSISLESAFWDELKEIWDELREIAWTEGISISRLVAKIRFDEQANRSSAVRVFVLEYLRQKTPSRSKTRRSAQVAAEPFQSRP
jgi:predicted DNA-binding ribbon-helix-helix protein